MDEFQGKASARVDAARQSVFDFITDLSRLPEWNAAIEAVTDKPVALTEGAEWRVTMHPQGLPRWVSVAKVEELDRTSFRFGYQTRNADGNPSYSQWAWELADSGGGTEVTVTWHVHLKMADRKYFAGPIRKRQLAREVPRSLTALATAMHASIVGEATG
jgi:uncharacterized protein YndB with AHSA1/START domain